MENQITESQKETAPEPSTLPSDVDAQQAQEDALDFTLTDAVKEKYLTKDGKLLGKYDNLEQLVESHKFLQDKHAMFVDDTKKQEKELNTGVEQEQVQIVQQETIQSLLPEFMNNGMQLTDDMRKVITETGIDERDLELGALKLKDKVNHVHELVGGKENWDNAKAYLATKLSEDEFKQINQDLVGSNSDYTVLGMYNAYQQSLNGQEPTARISGDTVTKSAKGYNSRQELFKDRQYLSTQAGRKDNNAQQKYRNKLALTNLNELGIKA